MLPAPPKKSESKRQVLFVGICADAVKLGVCREHLYRVLTGQRVSKSLLKRYQELKAKGDQPAHQPAQPKPVPTTVSAAIKPGAQPAPVRVDAAPRGFQKSTINMKGKL
jgi:hypothetical protein